MIIKDTINKILFAFELALLPWIVFSYIYIPNWQLVNAILVALILACHVGREFTKDKTGNLHKIMTIVSNIIVFMTLIIFYICISKTTIYINKTLGIVSIVTIIVYHLINYATSKLFLPETVEAIDYCNVLFEMLTLFAFIFVSFYSMIVTISLIAVILTAVASIAYKVYYLIRYYNIFNKIGDWFRSLRSKKK